MGGLAPVSAPIQFETACDVPKGGVLLALPALLAAGLLRRTAALYQMPSGGNWRCLAPWACQNWPGKKWMGINRKRDNYRRPSRTWIARSRLKAQRKQTPRHIAVKDLPESDRFSRLLTERKHFIDTIILIAYRAETSMASLLRDKLTRADDARALPRQIYDTEVDLIPDLENQTLTVRLHHLTQAAHDEAVRYLCDQLNATATIFPDTDLRLVYQLGAAQIP